MLTWIPDKQSGAVFENLANDGKIQYCWFVVVRGMARFIAYTGSGDRNMMYFDTPEKSKAYVEAIYSLRGGNHD